MTRPRLQPPSAPPPSSHRSGLVRILRNFFIPPSRSHSSTLRIHKQTRARISPPGVNELFNAHARPHTDTSRPPGDSRRCGAFSPVMLFAGQVCEVQMACLFFFDWGALLGARGRFAEMTERCRKSFVSREARRKDGTGEMIPVRCSWNLLCCTTRKTCCTQDWVSTSQCSAVVFTNM